jgi:hypothetical protein
MKQHKRPEALMRESNTWCENAAAFQHAGPMQTQWSR